MSSSFVWRRRRRRGRRRRLPPPTHASLKRQLGVTFIRPAPPKTSLRGLARLWFTRDESLYFSLPTYLPISSLHLVPIISISIVSICFSLHLNPGLLTSNTFHCFSLCPIMKELLGRSGIELSLTNLFLFFSLLKASCVFVVSFYLFPYRTLFV